MDHPRSYEEMCEQRNAKDRERVLNAKAKAQEDLARLKHAVRSLIEAAYWHADRPCDAHNIWQELRFAAGIQ